MRTHRRGAGTRALILGPGDLAASLGVPELTIGEGAHVEHALFRVAVVARAFGLSAIDGPHVVLDDDEGLRRSALRSRGFGYDGKWCIHPAQVEVCNDIYAPTAAEVERARESSESGVSHDSTGRWSTRRTAGWQKRSSRGSADPPAPGRPRSRRRATACNQDGDRRHRRVVDRERARREASDLRGSRSAGCDERRSVRGRLGVGRTDPRRVRGRRDRRCRDAPRRLAHLARRDRADHRDAGRNRAEGRRATKSRGVDRRAVPDRVRERERLSARRAANLGDRRRSCRRRPRVHRPVATRSDPRARAAPRSDAPAASPQTSQRSPTTLPPAAA